MVTLHPAANLLSQHWQAPLIEACGMVFHSSSSGVQSSQIFPGEGTRSHPRWSRTSYRCSTGDMCGEQRGHWRKGKYSASRNGAQPGDMRPDIATLKRDTEPHPSIEQRSYSFGWSAAVSNVHDPDGTSTCTMGNIHITNLLTNAKPCTLPNICIKELTPEVSTAGSSQVKSSVGRTVCYKPVDRRTHWERRPPPMRMNKKRTFLLTDLSQHLMGF